MSDMAEVIQITGDELRFKKNSEAYRVLMREHRRIRTAIEDMKADKAGRDLLNRVLEIIGT